MATAQRYKKLYPDRIPAEGEGRKQRYPAAAVKVFNALKKERVSKRGGSGRKPSPKRPAKAAASGAALLTLTSISEQTGISYPTLQRYVKLFGGRIPHEGAGRKRRYHPDSVAVFRQLRAESKPGRKPKAEAAAKAAKAPATKKRKARAKAAPRSAPGPKLLTLTAIGQQTGISSPTLQRYVKLHGDRIPHEGQGRKRRYHPEAVAVFREIRSKSKRGRKPKVKVEAAAPRKAAAPARKRKVPTAKVRRKAAPVAAQGGVEARLTALEAQVSQVLKKLEQPITITLKR
jgi:DNA-binding transcriptional MerR regulator